MEWMRQILLLAHLTSLSQMQFMLLFSRQGKLRLQKWYVPLSDKEKKKITRELVQTVLARKPKMCSFLEWRDLKIVYKRSVVHGQRWGFASWKHTTLTCFWAIEWPVVYPRAMLSTPSPSWWSYGSETLHNQTCKIIRHLDTTQKVSQRMNITVVFILYFPFIFD